ncbi:MAG: DUF2007 domain-containing protein [Armatimonadota bacterium]|nr:DUF2007 domain-containing protein [Armatimonadota bacterium]MCX7777504.1 DUF2007 domain-containing protein [Armatimonadota bacterium]MDW8025980.1 DUF2007 domain-containing protein [Armatimonadota bacterium]
MNETTERAKDKMVEVYRGLYSDVLVVRSLLESSGIQCIVKSHAAFGVHTFAVNGLAEAWILVHENDAEKALMLLSHTDEVKSG